jgi:predicted nucleic acid-binding protein
LSSTQTSSVIVGFRLFTALKPKPLSPKILIGSLPCCGAQEFRNIIALAIRRKLVAIEAAYDIVRKAEATFEGNEFAVSSDAVLQLVERSDCTAYDCEFVASAEEQQVPLITLDREILHEFPEVAISLNKFLRN